MEKFFHELLERLRLSLGLPALEMDDEYQCSVEMDGFLLLIRHFPATDQVFLSTSVAAIPADWDIERRLALYKALLQGQYFFQHSAGATLSINAEESLVALQKLADIRALSHESFLHIVERFMQTADYWLDRCKQCLQSSTEFNSRKTGLQGFSMGIRV